MEANNVTAGQKNAHGICVSNCLAFTLIEISIALVIIGLLVGGVLVGQDLIKAAEIRRAGSDINKVRLAAAVFQGEYDCLPGDCSKATNFFTLPANGGIWFLGDPNGNGNGLLDGTESYTRFWEHLSKSGLWNEDLNSQSPNGVEMGVNVPNFTWYSGNTNATANSNMGYTTRGVAMYPVYNYICPAGMAACETIPTSFTGKNMLAIQLIQVQWPPAARAIPDSGFSCNFAADFDAKFDDGMPHTGAVKSISIRYGYENCSNFDARSGLALPTTNPYVRNDTYRVAPLLVDLGL